MFQFADFHDAKWVWTKDNVTADQKIVLRKKLDLDSAVQQAYLSVSCETKFWLWINSMPVVYEGGVFRESIPGCGYAEKIDIAPYLQQGENVIAIFVWFYGNGGRNNKNSGEAGIIFACPEIGLYSDCDCKVCNHPAYQVTNEPHPSNLFGGHNIGFVAEKDFGDFTVADFDDSTFESATEYSNTVWGESVVSPLPLLRVLEKKELGFTRTGNGVVGKLPYAMTCSFGFVLEAEGGEVVDIRTDRYTVTGGPGDPSRYNGHRIEYIAKKGRNEYVCPMYLYGEEVQVSFPPSVKLLSLTCTESGYATDLVGSFRTDNELFNRLIEKSIRTLYVCMRNNFMDCPDRERGQWIGDVSVQAPQVFFVCDKNAQLLLKKSISDFIHLRNGDALVGNVPGEHAHELPSQSLVAICEFGLLGEYYHYTHDQEVLEISFDPIITYLNLWGMDEDGKLISRQGNWRWFDHLYNVDETVMEHGLYLSAAKFARKIADIIDRHDFDFLLDERIAILTETMESFWKVERYTSGTWVDDRANAIAVLSGVCPKWRYPFVRQILLSVQHATPYMERFVLKALCEMGYVEDAYHRMMSRYYNLIVNDNSTLWEDFNILGTRNHAWSGAPLEIAFRYFLGLKTEDAFNSYSVSPVSGIFKTIDCSFHANGKPVHLHLEEQDGVMRVVV